MSIDRTRSSQFVAAWYLGAGQSRADRGTCTALVTDDVQMIFPEATLPGITDFKAGTPGGRVRTARAPGVINIFFDENHNVVSVERTGGSDDEARARRWSSPGRRAGWKPRDQGKRTSLDATQTWTVRQARTRTRSASPSASTTRWRRRSPTRPASRACRSQSAASRAAASRACGHRKGGGNSTRRLLRARRRSKETTMVECSRYQARTDVQAAHPVHPRQEHRGPA